MSNSQEIYDLYDDTQANPNGYSEDIRARVKDARDKAKHAELTDLYNDSQSNPDKYSPDVRSRIGETYTQMTAPVTQKPQDLPFDVDTSQEKGRFGRDLSQEQKPPYPIAPSYMDENAKVNYYLGDRPEGKIPEGHPKALATDPKKRREAMDTASRYDIRLSEAEDRKIKSYRGYDNPALDKIYQMVGSNWIPGAYRVLPFLYELASLPFDGIAEATGIEELRPPDAGTVPVLKWLKKTADTLSNYYGQYDPNLRVKGTGFVDNLARGEYAEAGERAVYALLDAPFNVAEIMGIGLSGMAGKEGLQKWAELTDKDDIERFERVRAGVEMGMWVYLTSQIGDKKIQDALRDPKVVKGAVEGISSTLKEMGLAIPREGTQEFFEYMGDFLFDVANGRRSIDEFPEAFNEGLNRAISGAVAGPGMAGMAGPGQIAQGMQSAKAIDTRNKIKDEYTDRLIRRGMAPMDAMKQTEEDFSKDPELQKKATRKSMNERINLRGERETRAGRAKDLLEEGKPVEEVVEQMKEEFPYEEEQRPQAPGPVQPPEGMGIESTEGGLPEGFVPEAGPPLISEEQEQDLLDINAEMESVDPGDVESRDAIGLKMIANLAVANEEDQKKFLDFIEETITLKAVDDTPQDVVEDEEAISKLDQDLTEQEFAVELEKEMQELGLTQDLNTMLEGDLDERIRQEGPEADVPFFTPGKQEADVGEVEAQRAEQAPEGTGQAVAGATRIPLRRKPKNLTDDADIIKDALEKKRAEAQIEKIISTSKNLDEAWPRIRDKFSFLAPEVQVLHEFINARTSGKTNQTFSEWRNNPTQEPSTETLTGEPAPDMPQVLSDSITQRIQIPGGADNVQRQVLKSNKFDYNKTTGIWTAPSEKAFEKVSKLLNTREAIILGNPLKSPTFGADNTNVTKEEANRIAKDLQKDGFATEAQEGPDPDIPENNSLDNETADNIFDPSDQVSEPISLYGKPNPEPEIIATIYKRRLDKLKKDNPGAYWSVDRPADSVVEQAARDGRIINVAGGMGIVTKDGDMIGIFKHTESATAVGMKITGGQLSLGGIKLNNFDIYLTDIYEKKGFRVVSRLTFNPDMAPSDMPASVRAEKPDVVFMVFDPNNELGIKEKRFGKDDYNGAVKYQDSYVPGAQDVTGVVSVYIGNGVNMTSYTPITGTVSALELIQSGAEIDGDLPDIQRYIEARSRKINPFTTEGFNSLVETSVDEVLFQMQQADTGYGWYDERIKLAFQFLDQLDPWLKQQPILKDVLLFLTSIASPQSEVGTDMNAGRHVVRHMALNDEIRTRRTPDTMWTTRPSFQSGIEFMKYFLENIGTSKEFIVLLNTRMTKKAINEYRANAWTEAGPVTKYSDVRARALANHFGLKGAGTRALHPKTGKTYKVDVLDKKTKKMIARPVYKMSRDKVDRFLRNAIKENDGKVPIWIGNSDLVGKADDMFLFADMFGPKVGEFIKKTQGLNPDKAVLDLWMFRAYNRITGQKIQDKAKDSKHEAVAHRWAQAVADRLGEITKDRSFTLANTQAVMWYFEQLLYSNLGANNEARDYAKHTGQELEERNKQASKTTLRKGDLNAFEELSKLGSKVEGESLWEARVRREGIGTSYGSEPEMITKLRKLTSEVRENPVDYTVPGLSLKKYGPVDPKSPNFKRWFKKSQVVDEDGNPLLIYHGTTHDFEEFQMSRANPENNMGDGYYFSDSLDDVNQNYARRGPDLTNRIEQHAERIAYDIEQEIVEKAQEQPFKAPSEELVDAMDRAMEIATKELQGSQGAVVPVYLSLQNPAQFGGKDQTTFTFEEEYNEETEEYGEPEGTLIEFMSVLEGVLIANGAIESDFRGVAGAIYDRAVDYGQVSIQGIYDAISSSDLYLETDEGGLLSIGQIINETLRGLGFDGIIDRTVPQKFSAMGIHLGTSHYIVFDPTSIKSAVSNTGDFSSDLPSIVQETETSFEPTPPVNNQMSHNPENEAFETQYGKVKERTVLEGFKDAGFVDMAGTKIGGPQDIADLWSIYRSPNYEKLHFIFLKDGVVVSNTAMSSMTAGAVKPDPVQVGRAFSLGASAGADSYYILHNHPSGDPGISFDDFGMTANTVAEVKRMSENAIMAGVLETGMEFAGHVVTDGVEFSLISPQSLAKATQAHGRLMSPSKVLEIAHERIKFKDPKPKLADTDVFKIPLEATNNQPQALAQLSKAILQDGGYNSAVVLFNGDLSIYGYIVLENFDNPAELNNALRKIYQDNYRRRMIYVGNQKGIDLIKTPGYLQPGGLMDVVGENGLSQLDYGIQIEDDVTPPSQNLVAEQQRDYRAGPTWDNLAQKTKAKLELMASYIYEGGAISKDRFDHLMVKAIGPSVKPYLDPLFLDAQLTLEEPPSETATVAEFLEPVKLTGKVKYSRTSQFRQLRDEARSFLIIINQGIKVERKTTTEMTNHIIRYIRGTLPAEVARKYPIGKQPLTSMFVALRNMSKPNISDARKGEIVLKVMGQINTIVDKMETAQAYDQIRKVFKDSRGQSQSKKLVNKKIVFNQYDIIETMDILYRGSEKGAKAKLNRLKARKDQTGAELAKTNAQIEALKLVGDPEGIEARINDLLDSDYDTMSLTDRMLLENLFFALGPKADLNTLQRNSRTVRLLYKSGRSIQLAKDEKDRANYKGLIKAIVETLNPEGKPIPTPAQRKQQPKGSVDKFMHLFTTLRSMNESLPTMTEWLSKYDTQNNSLEGPLNELSYAIADATYQNKFSTEHHLRGVMISARQIYGKTFAKIMAENSVEQKLDLRITVPADEGGIDSGRTTMVEHNMTIEEAIHYWQLWQMAETNEDDGFKRTFENMGWTTDTIKDLEGYMTEKDLQWANWQIKWYDDYYSRVNNYYLEYFGVELPKSGLIYVPGFREKGEVDGQKLLESLTMGGKYRPTLISGSLKGKVPNSIPFAKMSSFDLITSHIINMERFINMYPSVKLLRKVFENTEVMDAIREVHSKGNESILGDIKSLVDDIERGRPDEQRTSVITALNHMKAGFAYTALGMNFRVFLKQLISSVAYMSRIDAVDIPAFLFDTVTTGIRLLIDNKRMSEEIKNTIGSTNFVKTRYYDNSFMHELNQTMDKAGIKRISKTKFKIKGEVKDVNNLTPEDVQIISQTLADKSMQPVRLGDYLGIALGGYAYYKNRLKKNQKKYGQAKAQAMARKEFARLAELTQNQSDTHSMSRIQRIPHLGGMLTMFQNGPMQFSRLATQAFTNLRTGRGSRRQAIMQILVINYLIPNLFYVVGHGFTGGDDDDRLMVNLLGAFAGLFFIGTAFENAYTFLFTDKNVNWFENVASFAPANAEKMVYKGLLDTKKAVTHIANAPDMGDLDYETIYDGVKGLATTFGIFGGKYFAGGMLPQGMKLAKGAYDLATGRSDIWSAPMGFSPYMMGEPWRADPTLGMVKEYHDNGRIVDSQDPVPYLEFTYEGTIRSRYELNKAGKKNRAEQELGKFVTELTKREHFGYDDALLNQIITNVPRKIAYKIDLLDEVAEDFGDPGMFMDYFSDLWGWGGISNVVAEEYLKENPEMAQRFSTQKHNSAKAKFKIALNRNKRKFGVF